MNVTLNHDGEKVGRYVYAKTAESIISRKKRKLLTFQSQ
jgi:hypothetical protein